MLIFFNTHPPNILWSKKALILLRDITAIILYGFVASYADLNPVVGSEQGGTRPVLVISNDIGNKHSPTVIIAAITSRVRKKKKLPTHLYLGQIEGLPANSIILFEQLRTIDKSRLKEHLTHLDEQYLKSLEFPLLISIGVEKRRSL